MLVSATRALHPGAGLIRFRGYAPRALPRPALAARHAGPALWMCHPQGQVPVNVTFIGLRAGQEPPARGCGPTWTPNMGLRAAASRAALASCAVSGRCGARNRSWPASDLRSSPACSPVWTLHQPCAWTGLPADRPSPETHVGKARR